MNQDNWTMAIGYAVISAGLTCGVGLLGLGVFAIIIAFLALPLYVGSIAESLRPLYALIINLTYSVATVVFAFLLYGFPRYPHGFKELLFILVGATIASSFLALIPKRVEERNPDKPNPRA